MRQSSHETGVVSLLKHLSLLLLLVVFVSFQL